MNPFNPNMIDSNTQYNNSSSDEIEDLNARIAKYSNIQSLPIGEFTDSDSDNDDNKDTDITDESEEEEDSDDEEIESQTESFNVSVRVRPLFSKEKMLNCKNIIKVMEEKYVILKNPEVVNKNDYLSLRIIFVPLSLNTNN